jgi:hypothetical protein
MKANSTDITISNSKFYNGLGIAMGSIGQYKDQFETIERVTVKNVEYYNTLHAVSDPFQRDFTTQSSHVDLLLTANVSVLHKNMDRRSEWLPTERGRRRTRM